jgi:hypothetical protein
MKFVAEAAVMVLEHRMAQECAVGTRLFPKNKFYSLY